MMKSVAIVWINYNSIKFINIVQKSLESLYELNYPSYKILVLDNCSNDGSDRIIKESIERVDKKNVIRFYRTSRNYGYTGGNLLGYLLAKDYEYFAVINNDVIVRSESLAKLIENIGNEDNIGAVQGILRFPNMIVNSAGHLLDEFLVSYAIGLGKIDHPYIKQSYNVTYTNGAYSVYRINALRRLNEVYFPEAFGYLDDDLIGVRMWNLGYKSKYVPVEAGIHYSGTTFMHYNTLADECNVRNRLIFRLITENRYKNLAIPASISRLFPTIINKKYFENISRAIVHGLNYARERVSRGYRIKANKVPLIKLTPLEILAHIILPNRISKRLVIERLKKKIPLG
ncbi:MAG: glycosyltransferase [Nitrososphaeria archaeon]|nr:glycosyltransferase [Nitrososphaeria archaeon]